MAAQNYGEKLSTKRAAVPFKDSLPVLGTDVKRIDTMISHKLGCQIPN